MKNDSRRERGLEMVHEMFGDSYGTDPLSTPIWDYTLRTMFGELLPALNLGRRDRRLLILGCLAGIGADASLFELHTRAALENGEMRVTELDDVVMLLVNYTGFPRISGIVAACEKLKAEFGEGEGTSDPEADVT